MNDKIEWHTYNTCNENNFHDHFHDSSCVQIWHIGMARLHHPSAVGPTYVSIYCSSSYRHMAYPSSRSHQHEKTHKHLESFGSTSRLNVYSIYVYHDIQKWAVENSSMALNRSPFRNHRDHHPWLCIALPMSPLIHRHCTCSLASKACEGGANVPYKRKRRKTTNSEI